MKLAILLMALLLVVTLLPAGNVTAQAASKKPGVVTKFTKSEVNPTTVTIAYNKVKNANGEWDLIPWSTQLGHMGAGIQYNEAYNDKYSMFKYKAGTANTVLDNTVDILNALGCNAERHDVAYDAIRFPQMAIGLQILQNLLQQQNNHSNTTAPANAGVAQKNNDRQEHLFRQ